MPFNYGAALTAACTLAIMTTHTSGSQAQDAQELLELINRQAAVIEDLRRQVEALERRTAANEQAAAVANETAAEAVATAETAGGDPTLKSGNDKIALSIRGQANRAVLFGDNGSQSDILSVDNDASSSRFGFYGTGEVAAGLTVGATIELEVESDSSNEVGFENSGSSFNLKERIIEVFAESDRFGKLSLGQGKTASDGTTEIDVSGTSVIGYSDLATLGGGFEFEGGGPRVRDVFNNFDGLGRDDRIRYDTPKFAGFRLGTSYANDSSASKFDVAGTFGGKFDAVEVQAGAHYASVDNNTDQYGGSISAKHESGVSATVALAVQNLDNTNRDPVFAYAKLAYTFKPLEWGNTSVAADIGYAEDQNAKNDEAVAVGAHIVQEIDAAAMDLYLGVRNYSLDRDNADFDDVIAVMSGARVKF